MFDIYPGPRPAWAENMSWFRWNVIGPVQDFRNEAIMFLLEDVKIPPILLCPVDRLSSEIGAAEYGLKYRFWEAPGWVLYEVNRQVLDYYS